MKTKIGIFGGTFNPIHNGHINSIETVQKVLELDKIHVVPTYQNPLRERVQGPPPELRLEMVRSALAGWGEVVVNDVEVKRGGISFSFDTIREFQKDFPTADLYLVIGADSFEGFDQWKEADQILERVNLVVTSRPGGAFPKDLEDLPDGIQGLVNSLDETSAELSTGKKILFVQLKDLDISSTDIRKKLRAKEDVSEFMPESEIEFIRQEKLYRSLNTSIEDYEEFTGECTSLLVEKNGINVMAYDVRELNQPSEYTIICSGTSSRHASSLAEKVVRTIKTRYGTYPQHSEGVKEGRWVVLDYGSLIIHIFYDFVRETYSLEELWKDGVRMPIGHAAPAKKASS